MRILEQVKPSAASQVFTDFLSNSPKCSLQFSPGYGMENMFYFLIIKGCLEDGGQEGWILCIPP